MAASPAPTLLPNAVALWRHALAEMPARVSPCRYLPAARWTDIRTAGLDFLDRFGTEAHHLGWTAPELFGVHPQHGTLRLDYCGSLMISGHAARGVDATGVLFERGSARRDKAGQVWGPPVWNFAKATV